MARATPGSAFVALAPGPSAGEFFVDDYLQDPDGWPAQSATHARGWSVAWRGAATPFGPERFIVRRGGGAALRDGALHPRYAAALEEMLPLRDAAILTLLDPPDTAACSPGKPSPLPFERDGWLFLHDGVIDIEAITMQVWRVAWGADWEAFKLAHPRDYDGNGDSTRGNASEIYGLFFLHELEQVPGDPGGALERAIGHLLALAGADSMQMNAVALSPDGLWVARYAMRDADLYPIYYGTTTRGEHCVLDAMPGAGTWESLPNFTLAHFPPDGPAELRALTPTGIDESATPPRPRLRLRLAGSPCVGSIRLACTMSPGADARLELWSLDGRRVGALAIAAETRAIRWEPPVQLGSGIYFARLRRGAESASVRLAIVR
jgi:hypothetical protein